MSVALFRDQCEGKRRYPSESSANRHRSILQRARRNKNLTLRAYPCAVCKNWHLTRKNYRK